MLAEKSGKQTFPTSLALGGERKFVIARTFNGPARIVFDAWTRAEPGAAPAGG